MLNFKLPTYILTIFIVLLMMSSSNAREGNQISIVGSSTVYPFSTIVAEKFGQSTGYPTPVIESTGTGGGMKLFCSGIGLEYPDITNASRKIKSGETELCANNGVEYQEFIVGNDGLAFSNSNESPQFKLSITHIYAALVNELPGGGINKDTDELKTNMLQSWNEVDAFVSSITGNPNVGLPNHPISIMVPPPTSGTRDAMGSLFMKAGAKKLGLKSYKSLREDGLAIEMGENDNLIIEKLSADPNTFGVFGYSFFDTNRDKVQASIVDGVELNFENISNYSYPGARPLFVYVKKIHVEVIPGLKEFVSEFISEKAMGMDGYLFPAGLVPLSDEDFAEQYSNLNNL